MSQKRWEDYQAWFGQDWPHEENDITDREYRGPVKFRLPELSQVERCHNIMSKQGTVASDMDDCGIIVFASPGRRLIFGFWTDGFRFFYTNKKNIVFMYPCMLHYSSKQHVLKNRLFYKLVMSKPESFSGPRIHETVFASFVAAAKRTASKLFKKPFAMASSRGIGAGESHTRTQ